MFAAAAAAAPHLLCSWRGLASLPSLPMGLLMRRKWDSVLAKASLFSTYRNRARKSRQMKMVGAGISGTATAKPIQSTNAFALEHHNTHAAFKTAHRAPKLHSTNSSAAFPPRVPTQDGRGILHALRGRDQQRRSCRSNPIPTWLTPARTPCVPCAPQLPVAKLYLRPLLMVPLRMAKGRFISLPLSSAFCT
jgi:hypothetical protein